jgi:hypothetical protein
MILPPVQAQHPEPGAVIAGGVLERLASGDLHDLDVDLHRIPGRRLLEEGELPRP